MRPAITAACLILFAAAVAAAPTAAAASSESVSRAKILGIPTLDDLAGDWLDMQELANPPAVHNFNQMLMVERDLTSYYCNPGGLYP